jgi:hypothetical protein
MSDMPIHYAGKSPPLFPICGSVKIVNGLADVQTMTTHKAEVTCPKCLEHMRAGTSMDRDITLLPGTQQATIERTVTQQEYVDLCEQAMSGTVQHPYFPLLVLTQILSRGKDGDKRLVWLIYGPRKVVALNRATVTAAQPVFSDDLIRAAVHAIKTRFLGWRVPPVELPADSVIRETAVELLCMGARADAGMGADAPIVAPKTGE